MNRSKIAYQKWAASRIIQKMESKLEDRKLSTHNGKFMWVDFLEIYDKAASDIVDSMVRSIEREEKKKGSPGVHSWQCGGCGTWYSFAVSTCECSKFAQISTSTTMTETTSSVIALKEKG